MSLFRERRRHSGLYSRVTTVNILRFFWACLIIWCEVGAFFWSLSNCKWPDREMRKMDRLAHPGHVMIIADPHYRASKVYAQSTSWVTRLAEFTKELNLRKSWNAVSRLRPHLVIMLGDMLDHGRTIMTDEQYDEYYGRFSNTFKLPKDVQTYYLTGNHDVGLGSHRAFSGQARRRFRQRFGPEQQVVDFWNHTFVLIDAPALVDEDYRRHAAEIDFESWQGAKAGPISFVKAVKNSLPPPDKPTILLSHIPLARRETAICGGDREDPKGIRRGAGYGFQNLLGKETTHFVLQSLKPALVISGDDHDYCDHTHHGDDGDVRELTVRTFSMASGVQRPGFLLLSLYTPHSGMPIQNWQNCLLPDQIRLFTFIYVPFILLTIAWLTYVNATNLSPLSASRGGPRARLGGPGTGGYETPPSTPSQLMIRRSASGLNLGTLSPRLLSRPSSPMLGPRVLFDDESYGMPSPTPGSPLLPSLMSPLVAEPDQLEDGLPIGNGTENGGTPRSIAAPPSMSKRRRGKSDSTGRKGWRESLPKMLDTSLELLGAVLSNKAFHPGPSRRSTEGLPMRVLRDALHTAWPPLLVLAFIWWRLLSW